MSHQDYDDQYRRAYNLAASGYDKTRFGHRKGVFDRDFKTEVILDVLEQRGLLGNNALVVDFAAGTGRITHALARYPYAKVIALDIAEEMLRINEETLPKAWGSRVEYRIASMKATGLAGERFDAATLGSFLYLLPREVYPAYLKDVRRVLKPGGILIAEIANAFSLASPLNFARVLVRRHILRKRVTSHLYPWEWKRAFHGFEIEEAIGTTYPALTSSYRTYARYSKRLGRSHLLKYVGGKCTVVLRKP
jgi:ubiquinone/menaquinone biosynthesis C-methylase UbiE